MWGLEGNTKPSFSLSLPIKVAEHSFQEPIPNSPLLLSNLLLIYPLASVFCKINHRRVYSRILSKV